MAETLPPLSIEQLNDALVNPHFSTYVYIGKQSDNAWKLALAAQRLLPALRVYCVAKSIATLLRREFEVPAQHVGVVFDWVDNVKVTLTKSKATDFLTLVQAITDARASNETET